MYVTIGIIAILVILILTGRKSVHHEITINSSPEKVWEVLTHVEEYPEWNPVMELLEGSFKEGSTVNYKFTQDEENQSEIQAKVIRIVPKETINQKGGLPLMLTFDHSYTLAPDGNATKVIIHEDYRGIGVNFWNPKAVEEAYGRLNKALKERVEKL